MHGLWPSGGSNYENCGDEFNENSITQSTLNDMQTYWSGLYTPGESFWEHEYDKHGSCFVGPNGQKGDEAFFSTALSVAQQADIYGALSSAGIVPGNSYDAHDIINAIHKSFGYSGFACQKGAIQQIEICLDLNFNYIDCSGTGNTCSGTVNYPSN
eukprot:CAMPEP_0114589490 /NCGR_PEP_ID=MMETSP0125-20121206/11919_1 /TAXON_ID=485358 ORGANISM="Aristerostoma sp., Strain ATCC 50986" /NCGR_SAMPLE_ID=MMETSP0125 /ASSEMBLY_ACC=CAM_ASM_000245 /LENGTH=155 /DNA_ID=CAMNT_0001786391 /DNA_START=198 /DNA_END=665 /DNA_ORIENTATION=+